jgi:hypothetical protein
MGKPFKGVMDVDIRESVPDWAPFEAPRAPAGALLRVPRRGDHLLRSRAHGWSPLVTEVAP